MLKLTVKLFKYIKSYTKILLFLFLLLTFFFSKIIKAQSLNLIQDAEIELYIREWIEPIIKVAGLNPNAVNVYIVNDETINAFVAGGQNIFINTGLILKAKEVDALIGVLAHEIGHIAGGHLNRTINSMKKAQDTVTIATIITAGLMAASKAAGLNTPSGLAKLATLGPSIAERNFYVTKSTKIENITKIEKNSQKLIKIDKNQQKFTEVDKNSQKPKLLIFI